MQYLLLLLATVFSCVVVMYVNYSDRMDDYLPTRVYNSLNLIKAGNEKPPLWELTAVPPNIAGNPRLSVEFLRSFYAKQAGSRRGILRQIRMKSGFATLYNALVPEVYCPDLIRVGNVDDGGKWVCKPQAMPQGNCSIYSLGLREDITFDREIQSFNNNTCRIYGFDLTAQSAGTHANYAAINGVAKQAKISTFTNASGLEITLGDILRRNNDSYTEILKMDIEGSEYVTLIPFLKEFRVCQIYLEMHGKAHQMLKLLAEIASLDYLLFFYEINGNDLAACEYSFIHSSCYERYGAFELSRYLNDSYVMQA